MANDYNAKLFFNIQQNNRENINNLLEELRKISKVSKDVLSSIIEKYDSSGWSCFHYAIEND